MSSIQVITHNFNTIEMLVQILYGGLIVLLLLFGLDLLQRFLLADKRTRRDPAYMVFFIIAVAMIGYGFYMFPAMVDYFYQNDYNFDSENIDWIKYLIIMLILFPIAFVVISIVLPKNKVVQISNLVIGGGTILYALILSIYLFIDTGEANIGSGFTIPVIILVILYGLIDFAGIIFILVVKLSPQKEVRKRVLLGLLGIVIAGIGGIIEANARSENTSSWWYVWGTVTELVGFLVMRHYFLSIPSYDEFAWKSGMIEMHVIIAETGISLYYRSFHQVAKADLKGDIKVTASMPESASRPNSDLVAGGLVGIKGMLAEISGDAGKLENIEIGEKSLVFKQGKVVLCLLLADENLGVYHSMLDDLVQKIELVHPNLDNFNGDTRQLKIEPIVDEIFGIDSSKKE